MKTFSKLILAACLFVLGLFVFLTSLGGRRTINYEAKTQAALRNALPQAELYWEGNKNSYAGVCESKEIVNLANSTLERANNITLPLSSVVCNDSQMAWAVSAPLIWDGKYFCTDSLGNATTTKRSLSLGETTCL